MSEAAATEEPKKKKETNIRETFESILVAFILAFIFRCFVVEAFVIPTGSMATTLMGAHMDFRCTHCGYDFSSEYRTSDTTFTIPEKARVRGRSGAIEDQVFSLYCPNCGLKVPRTDPSDPENDATAPSLKFGDRILVMKYVYLLHEPTRWDVIVFKSPQTDTNDYSVNYIKRLTGLPGESLFVAQGDLFVAANGKDPKDPKSYQVQTKPSWVQDALWRIVFDADYVPQEYTDTEMAKKREINWTHPWRITGGSGWFTNDKKYQVKPREFGFFNSEGAGTMEFDRTLTPSKGALTDWLAYDQSGDQGEADNYTSDSYALIRQGLFVSDVSDLKLSAVINKLEGPGHVSLVLGKGDDEFHAQVYRDKVRLVKVTQGRQQILGEIAQALSSNTRVTLQNVDYQVTLLINDKQVIQSTPAQYAPDVTAIVNSIKDNSDSMKNSSPKGYARLEGYKANFLLSHLQLWRDVYYRDMTRQTHGFYYNNRAVARRFPDNIVTLGKDEYFAMGDNSSNSSDARLWTNRVLIEEENLDVAAGRVPGRFLLGKAFFVYWPAGYRPATGFPALVPNFGEMRFIR